MAELEQTDLEYEIQYYKSFNSKLFIDSIHTLLLTCYTRNYDDLEKQIESVNATDPIAKEKSLSCLKERRDNVQKLVDENIAEIKPIIKQFFAIPRNILLAEDQMYNSENCQEDIDTVREKISKLKEEYERECIFEKILLEKLELNEALDAFKPLLDKFDLESVDLMKERMLKMLDLKQTKIMKTVDDSDSVL